jgi:hypothetical protein
MPKPFTKENAIEFARKGGMAKRGTGFKQKAQEWIRQNGFDKAIAWINGKSDRKATFAMGLLFSYALGRPAEQIQIEDRRQFLITLAADPALNELAKRFGNIAPGIYQGVDGGLVDRQSAIQTEGAAVSGI